MSLRKYIWTLVVGGLGPENRWRALILRSTLGNLRGITPHKRICNICGYKGFFGPFGWPIRPEVHCPKCLSVERHRLFKFWADANKGKLANRRILHFAADSTGDFLRPLATTYVTADLMGPADLKLDIENIDLPDGSFDVIVCSHVLEHVVNDAVALAEIYRVLSPGGIGLFSIPIIEGWPETYEDRTLTSPRDREVHFGQFDHVRYYGQDFRARVRTAGFRLDEFFLVGELVVSHALDMGDKLFIATKD
jgi:SAM-dependent methyltransferase